MTQTTPTPESSLVQWDKDHILHPATSITMLEKEGPKIIKGAQGAYIKDQHGRELFDGIAGLWCVNLGHGRIEIAEAMAKAATELDYAHTFNGQSNNAQIELSRKLVELSPPSLNHVFYGCSGSDANDTLVKIAWQYHITKGVPTKRKVISRWQAYHGTSISTASLTGLKGFHQAFHLPLDFVTHTLTPHYYLQARNSESETTFTQRLLTSLEQLIDEEGADNIAAFIGEPIMGAGGVITPPDGYWSGVQKICKHHNILIISDEVVCGYGRTGKPFGCQHYDFEPDMMSTAKGLTSGMFPMSASFISDDIHNTLREASQQLGSFFHGYTYSGHPVGAAVALKVLEIMHRESIVEHAQNIGQYLHQRLHDTFSQHPYIGEIRGKGLLAALQFVQQKEHKILFAPEDKIAAKAASACVEQGLIARPLPSIGALALSPPLTITRHDVDVIISKLSTAIGNL